MKRYCASILFFLICQVSLGQQRVVMGDKLYGLSNNLVYKADTMGNTEWVLDFSGKIKTGISDTNSLGLIATDGRFLYITSIQIEGTGILTYYPAIIVLDTAGSTRAIKYFQVNPTASYFISGLMANIDGGVWLVDYYVGLSHHLGLNKMDSLGVNSSSIGAWMSTDTYLNRMELLKDSTYMLSTITPFFGSGWISTITKTNRTGIPIWRKSIKHTSLYCIPGSSQVDSSGKTVMFIQMTDQGFTNYTVGVILSATGSLLCQKTWQENSIYSSGEITFQNNLIQYDDGTAKFYFDYTLTDSCLGGGVNESVIVVPETLQVSSGFQYVSGFLPVQDSLIQVSPLNTVTYPPNISLEYCLILKTDEVSNENFFYLHPNPAISSLQIQVNADDYKCIEKEIAYEITDINGRMMESGETTISEINNKIIDVSNYKAGIYFVKIKTKKLITVSRIIKM